MSGPQAGSLIGGRFEDGRLHKPCDQHLGLLYGHQKKPFQGEQLPYRSVRPIRVLHNSTLVPGVWVQGGFGASYGLGARWFGCMPEE